MHSDSPTSVTILGRIRRGLRKARSEPRQWVILVGDRLVIAGLLTLVFALVVWALMAAELVRVRNTSHVIYLAQGLIAGNVTLVTIVVSISQLVLSREFRTPEQLHNQIESILDYRSRIEERTGRPVVPTKPSDFLQVLLDGLHISAQQVGGAVTMSESDELRAEVDDLVETINTHTDHISDVLAESQGGIFSTLAVTLESNYAEAINEVHRLQTVYEDELTPEAFAMFNELVDSLKQMDIARQYFKSIYMQAELSKLSRNLLYVGLPAVGSAVVMFLVYAGGPSPAVAPTYLPWFVWSVVVLGFLPIAILASFVMRIAMVAQQTVAITPFTTPEEETEMSDHDRLTELNDAQWQDHRQR